jgi:hypothetical protein
MGKTKVRYILGQEGVPRAFYPSSRRGYVIKGLAPASDQDYLWVRGRLDLQTIPITRLCNQSYNRLYLVPREKLGNIALKIIEALPKRFKAREKVEEQLEALWIAETVNVSSGQLKFS